MRHFKVLFVICYIGCKTIPVSRVTGYVVMPSRDSPSLSRPPRTCC